MIRSRMSVVLAALIIASMAPGAWADVFVFNSMGEPDSNRAGEDLPEFIGGGDESVNEEDTAGEDSTASMQMDTTTGEGEIFNDHYDDPYDASCCSDYFNFYIKVLEGSIDQMTVWGTTDDWGDLFNWEDIDVSEINSGEWVYVSLAMTDWTTDDGGQDFSTLQTIGISWESTDLVFLTDHWTLSNESAEGMLTPPGPNLTLGVEGNTYAEEGGDITLSANDDMIAGGSLQWQLDGVNIGSETGATYAIIGATTADSGVYTLNFEDGEGKALISSNPVSIAIFPAGSLPVAGLIGLGLLALAGAFGGVVALRRK